MPVKYLALSGGGMKGLAYVGVLRGLEKRNIIQDIEAIAGTSIGAFVGLLIVLGYTSRDLEAAFLHLDVTTNCSIKLFMDVYGFDDGSKIEDAIASFLVQKGYSPNATFADLHQRARIEFHCVVTNLNERKPLTLNIRECPELRLSDAIRMSMALPFMFAPGSLQGDTIVDGGMTMNLPISLFDSFPRETVLGFYLIGSSRPEIRNQRFDILDIQSFIGASMSCLLHQIETFELEIFKQKQYNIVPVHAGTVSTLDTTLDIPTKLLAMQHGEDSLDHYFQFQSISITSAM